MSDYEVKEVQAGTSIEGRKKSRLSWCDPKMAAFTLSFGSTALVTQAVNAYLSSQVTTLEKAFGLTSTQSGFLNSANDVGVLTIVIFCSHFARKLHIPRFLAASTFIYGLSAMLCSLPHFIYGSTDKIDINGTQTIHSQEMCLQNDNSTAEYCASTQVLTKQNSNSVAYGIVIMGMIMQGMAKSARTPLMTIYIDNNVGSRKQTAPYLGIINSIMMFGPSSAFALGGLFAGIYVTLEDTELIRKDPRWIGAWYLGFLLYGGLALILGIPLCFFSKTLKRTHGGSNEIEQGNVEMAGDNGDALHEKSANDKSLFHLIKDLLASMSKLSTNVVYVLTICATCMFTLTTAGPASFQAKYIERQFNMTSSSANIIMGATLMVSNALGNLSGGLLVGKFKLGLKGCIRFSAVFIALSATMAACGAIFGCPQPVINGPNGASDTKYDVACGSDCACPETDFFPICGADGQNYHSPCFAGCKVQNATLIGDNGFVMLPGSPPSVIQALYESSSNNTVLLFGDCDCIPGGTATPGLCSFDCNSLVPYAAMRALLSLFGFMSVTAMAMVKIYSVPNDMRALALGVSGFFSAMLGWLPGPVLYGRVIDTACTVWNYSCGQQGSCAHYDLFDIRIKFHMLTFAFRLTGSLLMCGGLIHLYRKSSKAVKITSTKI